MTIESSRSVLFIGMIQSLRRVLFIVYGNRKFRKLFVAPNTTTSTKAVNYTGIYNIINEDDFVPYLPMAVGDLLVMENLLQ